MLEKLKQYKEFMAILVFFVAGFVWLEREFPTKSNLEAKTASLNSDLRSEIRWLDCRLEKYVTLMQLQIRGQELGKEVRRLDEEIKTTFSVLSDDPNLILSPGMEHDLEELKADLKDKKNELKENNIAMRELNDELQRNVCRKEAP